jgi:hypothetical protein
MEPTAVAVAGGETEPNGEPTALRVISPHPSDVHSSTALMQTSQPLDSGARNGQNSQQLRDVRTREAGALCRPGRTEEERERGVRA